jgi:hypothetical protein
MPRKAISNDKELEDQIIKVFEYEYINTQERFEIARRWCMGNYEYHRQIAAKKNLLPIALLIACLVDIDHQLLVSPGRGVMYSSMKCAEIVLDVMLHQKAVDVPVTDSFHNQPVERMEQP